MRRSVTATLLFVLFAGRSASVQTADAQSPGVQQPPAAAGEIRGKVVESKSQEPVARASLAVRQKGGTAIITGAITGANGTFRLQGLRPGTYTLRTTYIGYAPIVQEVAIVPASPIVELPPIALNRVAVELTGVAVQAEKSTVTIEPDRTTYRAKDVAPAAANASEVLDAVPSVVVDGDGKVSYRGNENVAVQINGRPSPMRGTQLAAYLKSLPANIIERIEVVPNPSAKYDPEGMAGILNIILKQNVDLGLSAGLNGAASQPDRYFGSGNLGYQSGPWSSFSSVGINRDARNVFGINDRERYNALNALTGVTAQDIDGDMRSTGQNVTTSVDYKLTDRDVLSNVLTFNHRDSGDESVNAYTELDGSRVTTSSYLRPKSTVASGWMLDYDLALKRTFEQRKHELSAEVRYNYADDDDQQRLWRQLLPAGTPLQTEREHDVNGSLARSFTGQTDYMKAFAPRTKLEAGYKGTVRWLDRDYLVEKDSLGLGTFVTSPLSNAFSFNESVNAVYGVFSQGVGKFDLQAGLRGEHADRNFNLAGDASYPYSYNSAYPSAVILYNATQATQLKASYSRRVRRPGTQELNPFVQFFDVQNVFIGNPALAPEYTDAFEGGVTKQMAHGNVQFSPFYRKTTNIIRVDINTTDTIAGRELTSISFENLATGNSWGADMNGALRLGPKFNGFAGFNLSKVVTDGGSTSAVGSDAVTWFGRVNGTSEVTKTLLIQGSFFYRAPMNIERGRFERQMMANFAVRKKLDGDKLTATLRMNDPFNTGAFKVRVGDEKVTQITTRSFQSRMVWLAFQYSYGRPPRLRQPKQDDQGGGSSGFAPPPA
jgi:outer membrane receptor protein involved in Fe transport